MLSQRRCLIKWGHISFLAVIVRQLSKDQIQFGIMAVGSKG
jgi:hypothetical protein